MRDARRHRGIWANKWASSAGIGILVFCIPNKVMDLGNDHCGLKTLEKEGQLFIVPHDESSYHCLQGILN